MIVNHGVCEMESCLRGTHHFIENDKLKIKYSYLILLLTCAEEMILPTDDLEFKLFLLHV